MLICYDRSFSEAWSCLALKGAELVMVPTTSSGWRNESWEFGLRTHALENCVFVVAPNRTGKEDYYKQNCPAFFGTSIIINPLGNVLAKAGSDSEEIITAELDLEELNEARRRNYFFRDWHLEAYDTYFQEYSKILNRMASATIVAPEKSNTPRRRRANNV